MPLRITLALFLASALAAFAGEGSKDKKPAGAAKVEKTDKKERMRVTTPQEHAAWSKKKQTASTEEPESKGVQSRDAANGRASGKRPSAAKN